MNSELSQYPIIALSKLQNLKLRFGIQTPALESGTRQFCSSMVIAQVRTSFRPNEFNLILWQFLDEVFGCPL
jgi:hypothetical protein